MMSRWNDPLNLVGLFVVLALVLNGCGSASPVTRAERPEPERVLVERVQVAKWTKRIIDCETQTACYVYSSYGISCVPLLSAVEECR